MEFSEKWIQLDIIILSLLTFKMIKVTYFLSVLDPRLGRHIKSHTYTHTDDLKVEVKLCGK